MIRHFLSSLFIKKQNGRFSVKRKEENQLLKLVLEHAQNILKQYSIQDPTNQSIDLMLAPTLIKEAIEMLENQNIGTRSLLIEYQVMKYKKRLTKGEY